MTDDPRIAAVPDIHGHAKGEHKLYVDERPIPYTARMLFLWFFHACRRGAPRFLMVADHVNYLTFEDPAAVNLVRRALKLAQAGDLYGAAETAGVDVQHAAIVGDGLRRGMRYSIGAEVDNDPRSRPDAQNIVDAMRPDGIVRSVHFLAIKHPQFGENWMWPFDNPEFRDVYDIVGTEQTWELYMATLLDAIEKLPGHIVGHFYVPAKFGHWPSDEVLEAYEDRMLDACAERGMAVEINSRYYYKHALDDEAQLEKYSAANMRLLRKAKEKGVMVAVGSDAHSPKDQGHGFGEILALLDRAEINEIAFPIDGRLARVALRATEELRKASSKAAREERTLALPIPGTEDPEAADDEDTETTASEGERSAVAAERPAAAVPKAPKKRPSRAKKARAAEPAPDDAVQPAEASHGEAPPPEPAEKVNPAAAVVEAISSAAKRVSQKVVATLQSLESKTASPERQAVESKPTTADASASDEAVAELQAAVAEPEAAATAVDVPENVAGATTVPETSAAEAEEPEAVAAGVAAFEDAGAEAGVAEATAAEATAAKATAAAEPETVAAAEATVPQSGAAGAKAGAADAESVALTPTVPQSKPVEGKAAVGEPESVATEPGTVAAKAQFLTDEAVAPEEPVAVAQPSTVVSAEKSRPQTAVAPDDVVLEARKMPEKHVPGSAETARAKATSGSSGAGARSRTKTSRPVPAATAKRAAKRSAKPAAKVVRASKSGVKKSAPSKGAPAAKKRVVKKAAPTAAKKVSRRSPSAVPAAKKATAKKAAPLRKASKAAPVKTASRSTGKKAGAKKSSAKKKTSKSRR